MPPSLFDMLRRILEYLWPAVVLVLAQLAGLMLVYLLMN
jgi:hypothetical protein